MQNRTGIERFMRARITISPLFVVAGALLLLMPPAVASQVGSLTTFTNGTPANADEVNANFDALRTAVNDNDTRITTLESASAPAPEQLLMSGGINPGGGGNVWGMYNQAGSPGSASLLIPRAGTLEDMRASVFATLAAGSQMQVFLVINGVDTAASITITPANGTAMLSSASGPIAVAAGDLVAFRVTENGGSNTSPGTTTHATVTLK